MFRNLDELVQAATSKGPTRIAVAAGHDPDVIEALKQAQELGLAEGILIGDGKKIRSMTEEIGFELSDHQLIDEPDDAKAARKAIDLIRKNEAKLLMKGKINTAALIRAVLDREAGLRTGRLLSQVIVFQVPGLDRLMVMTDAAINVAPDAGTESRDLAQRDRGRSCHRHSGTQRRDSVCARIRQP